MSESLARLEPADGLGHDSTQAKAKPTRTGTCGSPSGGRVQGRVSTILGSGTGLRSDASAFLFFLIYQMGRFLLRGCPGRGGVTANGWDERWSGIHKAIVKMLGTATAFPRQDVPPSWRVTCAAC